ncbi:transposase family Tnp2 protein, partial [Rhizoctonia solani AG-3 Rhs1AP]
MESIGSFDGPDPNPRPLVDTDAADGSNAHAVAFTGASGRESPHSLFEDLPVSPFPWHTNDLPAAEPHESDEELEALPEIPRFHPFDQLLDEEPDTYRMGAQPIIDDHPMDDYQEVNDDVIELDGDYFDENLGLPEADNHPPTNEQPIFQYPVDEEPDDDPDGEPNPEDNTGAQYTAFQEPALIRNIYIDIFIQKYLFRATKEGGYSVGACYLAINNLPRHMRFLRENIALCMIMPGPNEPNDYALDQMLDPLLEELLQLQQGVRMTIREGDPPVYREEVVHATITQHIADLIARIKIGGGAGVKSEKNFCLYCHTRLSALSVPDGYRRQGFVYRDPDEDLAHAYQWKYAQSQEERKNLFEQTAVNIIDKRSITPAEAQFAQQLLESLCIDYVSNSIQLPPNFHYLMHLEEWIFKTGSVYNTHVWGMERANGIVSRIKHNGKGKGVLEGTLMRGWWSHVTLQNLIKTMRALPDRTPADESLIVRPTRRSQGWK